MVKALSRNFEGIDSFFTRTVKAEGRGKRGLARAGCRARMPADDGFEEEG